MKDVEITLQVDKIEIQKNCLYQGKTLSFPTAL